MTGVYIGQPLTAFQHIPMWLGISKSGLAQAWFTNEMNMVKNVSNNTAALRTISCCVNNVWRRAAQGSGGILII